MPITVVTCDDRKDINRTALKKISDFCIDHGLPYMIYDNSQLTEYISTNKPDLCLVCGWYWIIEAEVISSCKRCIGLHNSLLPGYRGGAPLVWSIMNGDITLGSSLWEINSGMDSGDIIYQWKIEVNDDQSIKEILPILEEKVTADIGSVVRKYLSGKIQPIPQANEGVSFGSQRKKEDSLINWSLSAKDLRNCFRALQFPYPQLYLKYQCIEYEIYDLTVSLAQCFGKPGQILAYYNSGILVSCGSNNEGVLISDLRIAGNNRNFVSEKFFRVGTILL